MQNQKNVQHESVEPTIQRIRDAIGFIKRRMAGLLRRRDIKLMRGGPVGPAPKKSPEETQGAGGTGEVSHCHQNNAETDSWDMDGPRARAPYAGDERIIELTECRAGVIFSKVFNPSHS